jgi:hypothetical protein
MWQTIYHVKLARKTWISIRLAERAERPGDDDRREASPAQGKPNAA